MADNNDIARIGYVLNTYDSVNAVRNNDGLIQTSNEFKNADGTAAPLVKFQKKVNGIYYVVEAVPDSKAHAIRIVSVYMSNKKGSTGQELNMPIDSPQLTPETPLHANTSVSSTVPQSEPTVKPKNRTNGEVLSAEQESNRTAVLNAQNGEISADSKAEMAALEAVAYADSKEQFDIR